MTKYLVKIISICSFIVLIPIIIVGVALSAVGSSLFKLDTFVVGADSQSASYSITIGEKDKDKKEVTSASFINGTEVNLAITTQGYDFIGWYNGDDKTYNPEGEVLSRDASYTFELKDNMQVTALVRVQNYKLAFSGKYDNGDDITASDETLNNVSLASDNYVYGMALPLLQARGDATTAFLGWRIQNTIDEPTKLANFAKSTTGEEVYVLEPVWSDRATVVYYTMVGGEWTIFDTQMYSATQLAAFDFLPQNDPKVVAAIGKGYNFVDWVDGNGNKMEATDISEQPFDKTAVYNVYLKKVAKEYTVKVNSNIEANTGLIEKSQNISFSIENGFGEITLERDYYNFVGLKFNGKVYTLNDGEYYNETEKLSDVIIGYETNGIAADAVWACMYPEVQVRYSALNTDGDDIFVKNVDDTYSKLADPQVTNTFEFVDGQTGAFKMEDNMFTWFSNEVATHGQLYTKNASEYSETTVTLQEIRLYTTLNNPILIANSAATFEYLVSQYGSAFSNLIEVAFIFA